MTTEPPTSGRSDESPLWQDWPDSLANRQPITEATLDKLRAWQQELLAQDPKAPTEHYALRLRPQEQPPAPEPLANTPPRKFAAPEPTTYDVMAIAPCPAFRWVGQAHWSCDRCGKPYWEHSHDEISRGRRTLHAVIPREQARAVERQWA